MSKNIDLAAEYLQRDLVCAKWRIKLNSKKNKSHNILQVPNCNKGRTCFIFIWRPSFVLSSYKILRYHFDNRMTFTKHFEEILEHCSQKLHSLRILVNKKWVPSPTTILQIYKQCVRPIFEYGIVSTITVSESVINKIQNPKLLYASACLLHEAWGLPYVRERLITVAQSYVTRMHANRMHANPLVEHRIISARTNTARDKYKTPISILKPPD